MATDVKPFRPTPNWTIMNSIRNGASSDYQARVNAATKANIQETVRDMWDHEPSRNAFLDGFINQIGRIVARNLSWENPLSIFKMGMLEWGITIEEYAVGLVEAQAYDPNRDYLERDLFGQAVVDVQTSFHKVNRQDMYKITVNEAELKRAFLSENGLHTLIGNIMAAPNTSDNWDEFLLMTSLFREYDDNGGFFNVKTADVAAAASDAAAAKSLLRQIKTYAKKLTFISTNYNAARMPVAAALSKMVLFVTPEVDAALDVEALATLFHMEKAEVQMRKIVIPQENFRIPGVQAILTTDDFFVVADQRLETRSLPNPMGLYSNYWLHHWEVISASRFVPAIMFNSLRETTIIQSDNTPVTSIPALVLLNSLGADVTSVGEVERGQFYTVVGEAVTTPAGGTNDAIRFSIANPDVGSFKPRTFVSQTGTLYISPDEDATRININEVATDNETITRTTTFTIVGDKVQVWPDAALLTDEDDDGLLEVVPATVGPAPTSGANKNKVTIPTVEGVEYRDGVTPVTGTITLTANKTITAVAKTGYELKSGATASWNLVFTA